MTLQWLITQRKSQKRLMVVHVLFLTWPHLLSDLMFFTAPAPPPQLTLLPPCWPLRYQTCPTSGPLHLLFPSSQILLARDLQGSPPRPLCNHTQVPPSR